MKVEELKVWGKNRKTRLSREWMENADGKPFRVIGARIVPCNIDDGANSDASTAASVAATATGIALTENSLYRFADIVTYDVPEGFVAVVTRALWRPHSAVGYDVLVPFMIDSGSNGQTGGQQSQAFQPFQPPAGSPLDGCAPFDPDFQVGGPATIRFAVTNLDKESWHLVQAEFGGMIYSAEQFRKLARAGDPS